jgi:ubiquinone/menaquinone biosynthesis C-methylase UbiE
LDPSLGMLKKAVEKELDTIQAVAEHLPLKRNCLDFIYLVAVIEFLRDPCRVLIDASETLKVKATLITLTINRDSPWGKYYKELAEKGEPLLSRAKFYNYDEMMGMFGVTCFKVNKVLSILKDPPESLVDTSYHPLDLNAGAVLIGAKKQ